MPAIESPTTEEPRLLLAEGFRHRLDEEVARVRRSGGFLSLALFKAASAAGAGAAIGSC